MRVFCHACWLAAFSWRDLSVQSEENMEDLHHRHALGCIDCFPAAGKSHIKSQRSPDAISHPPIPPHRPPHPHPHPQRARERALQAWCDKINLVVTALPPLPAARGAGFIGLNKDLTQSYSLHFQTGNGTVSKRKASDTEVSKKKKKKCKISPTDYWIYCSSKLWPTVKSDEN